MTTASRGNWLDKLAAFVPGYKGYKDQPIRRNTDRLLRESTVKRLLEGRAGIDRTIADATARKDDVLLEKLKKVQAGVDKLVEDLKRVPPGYAGLFEAFTIEMTMLYRLYRYDLSLRDRTEEVVLLISGLPAAKNAADMSDQIAAGLQLVAESLKSRDQAVGEIR